jgi:hypothetical protein
MSENSEAMRSQELVSPSNQKAKRILNER